MSIDPFSEELLTLSEAARFCPRRRQGKKPHLSTLHRWATRGSRGVVLDTLQTPGGLCTSKEALRRFFGQLTSAKNLASRNCQPRQDEHRHAVAERELKRRFGV